MMFFGDPIYSLLMIVGMGLVFLPQMWVKNTYNHYREVPTASGMTGAQLAEALLRENRVHDVEVEQVAGELSDHYDPGAKRVRLSPDNYSGSSVAALAIAAHEVGHAIQHATGYYPVVLRGTLVPAANLGSQLGPLVLMLSLGMGFTSHTLPDFAIAIAWFGVFLFGASVAFHLVTLPVELNASMRAIRILENGRYLSSTEFPGAKKVLTAAAFTYVAVALYSLMQLVYWVFRLLNASSDRNR